VWGVRRSDVYKAIGIRRSRAVYRMDTFSDFEELLDESFSQGTYIIYFYCLMLSNAKITLTAKLNLLNCNFDIV
jgi:hypothetical protein